MRRYVFLFLLFVSGICYGQLSTGRLLSIGRNALYFEDYVLSIQYFNQVIKIKPFLAEPYFYMVMATTHFDDIQGADTDVNSVTERNPYIPVAFSLLGPAREHSGNMDVERAACTYAM